MFFSCADPVGGGSLRPNAAPSKGPGRRRTRPRIGCRRGAQQYKKETAAARKGSLTDSRDPTSASAQPTSSLSAMSTTSTPAPAAADDKPTLTLGRLWESLALLPEDAMIARIELAPTFVVATRSGPLTQTGFGSALDKVDPDAFEGAAAITVYEYARNAVPVSDVRTQMAPLTLRHSHRPLVTSDGAAVTGLGTVSIVTVGKHGVVAEKGRSLVAASPTVIKAVEVLAKTARIDDAALVCAVEPLVPDGLRIGLYKVGDRVFDVADLAVALPRLCVYERNDLFVEVARPAGPKKGMHGALSLWSAPADITYDLLVAAFGPVKSPLARLRATVACARAAPDARDCPQ